MRNDFAKFMEYCRDDQSWDTLEALRRECEQYTEDPDVIEGSFRVISTTDFPGD